MKAVLVRQPGGAENLVLGEVEETIYTVDEEDDGGNGEVRTVKKQSEMLFVRGRLLCCFGRFTG